MSNTSRDLPQLFAALADRTIDEHGLATLEAVLLSDRLARDEFRRWMGMEAVLSWGLGDALLPTPRPAAREIQGGLDNAPHGATPRFLNKLLSRAAALAGLVIASVAGIAFVTNHWAPPAATLTDVSADAAWEGQGLLRCGQSVPSGPLRLSRGSAQLRFASGAVVALNAPALVEVLAGDRLFLRSGRIVPHVPSVAKGFTVVSPGGEIIDLGTEFSVSVDDKGKTDVYVIDGEVDVVGGHGIRSPQQRMTQGFASQFAAQEQTPRLTQLPLVLDGFTSPGGDASQPGERLRWVDIDADRKARVENGALCVPISGAPGRKYPIARVLLDHDFSRMVGGKSTISVKVTLPRIGTTPRDRWAGLSLDSQSSPPQMGYSDQTAAAVLVSPGFQSAVFVKGQRVVQSRVFSRDEDAIGPYQIMVSIDDTAAGRKRHAGTTFDVTINGVRVAENLPIDLGARPRLTFQSNTLDRVGGEGFALFDDVCVSVETEESAG